MSDKSIDYSIIDEIYLENEDKLRECKLAQVMLQVEIKNNETMLQQEEDKKDPNRGIFHTVDDFTMPHQRENAQREDREKHKGKSAPSAFSVLATDHVDAL